MKNYVIVGTGVSGIAAAEAIRSQDAQANITFIGDDPFGYYSRPGLAYYLTREIDEKLIYPYSAEDFKRLNARFIRQKAVMVDEKEHQVKLANGQMTTYERLLLAPGSAAIPLNIPGVMLEGVVKLDHLEDARKIVRLAKKARTAVVVGGGITALELAEGLASQNLKVHLLMRTQHYWSNVLDEVESEIVENCLKKKSITLHPCTELAEIHAKNGRVASVRLKSGEIIQCGMVAYAIGVQPRLSPAQQSGIACERGILVDACLRTSAPDVFASGDAAQIQDPISGRKVLNSLWHPAREQGRIAGLNMTGQNLIYQKTMPLNVTRLGGLTTTIIGSVGTGKDGEPLTIARGDSETWRDVPDAIIAQGGFDINHIRVMVGRKTIVGAILIGDQKLSPALQEIVRSGIDISSIRGQLITPAAPIADVIARFWENHQNTL